MNTSSNSRNNISKLNFSLLHNFDSNDTEKN